MLLWRPGSLRRWLSRWLAVLTFVVLGGISVVIYNAVNFNLEARQSALI